jgi:hypothetical protein
MRFQKIQLTIALRKNEFDSVEFQGSNYEWQHTEALILMTQVQLIEFHLIEIVI